MADIEITFPGKDVPGHMKRQRQIAVVVEQLQTHFSPQAVDDFIDWILSTAIEVKVPNGIDPRDAIFDLSENEFNVLLENVRGGNNTVDPQNGG